MVWLRQNLRPVRKYETDRPHERLYANAGAVMMNLRKIKHVVGLAGVVGRVLSGCATLFQRGPSPDHIHSLRLARRAGWVCGVALCISAESAAASDPAEKRWIQGEAQHVIVYGKYDVPTLRAEIEKIEAFDEMLRKDSRRPDVEPVQYRLPIYLVSSSAALVEAIGEDGRSVGGVYYPSETETFIASRAGEILLHEYHHHFMLSDPDLTWRHWFIEGLADYYMTADIVVRKVNVGRFSDRRLSWLKAKAWISLEDLLTKQISDVKGDDYQTYNPVAALMVNWFYSSDDRRAMLDDYFQRLDRDEQPVEALEKATSRSIAELTLDLKAYAGAEQWTIRSIDISGAAVPIDFAELQPAASDLLLLNQRLKLNPPAADRPALWQSVQKSVEAHTDDQFALLTLGRAGLTLDHAPEGEGALNDVLRRSPTNAEAHFLLAQYKVRGARKETEADSRSQLLEGADAHLKAALAGTADYRALVLRDQWRRLQQQSSYPTDSDRDNLKRAFYAAPHLPSVRMGYAEALAANGDSDAAAHVITPLVRRSPSTRQSLRALEFLRNLGKPPPAG